MMRLFDIPEWNRKNDRLWETILRKNTWFIKLRYFAVLFVLLFILLGKSGLLFHLQSYQAASLFGMALLALLYNLIFQNRLERIRENLTCESVFNLSFVQICTDLIVLFLIIHLTGGIESPFAIFVMFHLIIGSIILPRAPMLLITLLIAAFYILIAVLEASGMIAHYPLIGLFPFPMYRYWPYIVVHSFVFTFALLLGFTFLTKITADIFRLEEDLFDSVQQLENADVNKQKYVMAIVHEIKTPLTAIHSFLSLILNKTLGEMPAPIEERLQRSLERSDEAVQLVNNVLRISRLRLLNELTKADFNFTSMIQQMIQKVTPIIEEKKLHMECSYDSGLILNVYGDFTLLNMAIQNIIGNAIKYTHAGGRILIKLMQEPEGLCLTVADSGIGIPAGEFPKIFRDTFRASNAKQKGIEGAGFGLAIVKHIIENHHGTIDIKSPSGIGDSENPGTEVEIYIPYQG